MTDIVQHTKTSTKDYQILRHWVLESQTTKEKNKSQKTDKVLQTKICTCLLELVRTQGTP